MMYNLNDKVLSDRQIAALKATPILKIPADEKSQNIEIAMMQSFAALLRGEADMMICVAVRVALENADHGVMPQSYRELINLIDRELDKLEQKPIQGIVTGRNTVKVNIQTIP